MKRKRISIYDYPNFWKRVYERSLKILENDNKIPGDAAYKLARHEIEEEVKEVLVQQELNFN